MNQDQILIITVIISIRVIFFILKMVISDANSHSYLLLYLRVKDVEFNGK